MNAFTKTVLGVSAAALVAVPLAACSSSGGSSSSSSSSSVDPSAPLATVNDLSKGKMTQVTLDSGFVGALTKLKVAPGTVGTATLTSGVLSFPITSGNVKYYNPTGPVQPFVTGDIKHAGSGISLTAGKTKVSLTNFDIDPGASKLYGDVAVNGKTAFKHTYLFYLDGRSLKPLQTSGTDAILEGTKVEIQPTAAALLNTTFKIPAGTIPANFLVGIAKITVATA